jgi:hypothetical protein
MPRLPVVLRSFLLNDMPGIVHFLHEFGSYSIGCVVSFILRFRWRAEARTFKDSRVHPEGVPSRVRAVKL